MEKRRPTLILSGQQLCRDKMLNNLLLKKYNLVCLKDTKRLEAAAIRKGANLIIIELLRNGTPQLEIVKRLKAKLAEIAIVVVTGNQDVQDNAEILIAGASDVFPLPYHPEFLAERVDGLLKFFNSSTLIDKVSIQCLGLSSILHLCGEFIN